jgi:hypothetical protein
LLDVISGSSVEQLSFLSLSICEFLSVLFPLGLSSSDGSRRFLHPDEKDKNYCACSCSCLCFFGGSGLLFVISLYLASNELSLIFQFVSGNLPNPIQ